MSASWNTKWGARRVRHDPPTLAEAIAAARDVTDDREGLAEIAAGLMGVSIADARAEVRRLALDRRATVTAVAAKRDQGGVRTVIIERRTRRRAHPVSSRLEVPVHPR